ncbi:MAG: dihydrodipicolinate synthase family protein [Sedimentisphaerales bacterium]|nr:dihydrodipicolinate synthase family protein [Sedimentisphaerales bacterium]
MKFNGLVPAVFTPMHADGSLNLDIIPAIVDHVLANNCCGVYICGSTGEAASLTCQERMLVAEHYINAVKGRIPTIVNVGHDCLADAQRLATHARDIKADMISAYQPNYFRCESLNALLACIKEICRGAPDLPFIYYHTPRAGSSFDMYEFLKAGKECIPSLAGIKFSTTNIHEYQECLLCQNGRFCMFFGTDPMLLSALSVGSKASIGTSFSFAAPVLNRVISCYRRGDMSGAQKWQGCSVAMTRILFKHRGLPAFKAMMKLIGLNCGPTRLPLVALIDAETASLKQELEEIGFFDWLEPDDKLHRVMEVKPEIIEQNRMVRG